MLTPLKLHKAEAIADCLQQLLYNECRTQIIQALFQPIKIVFFRGKQEQLSH